MDRRLPPRVTYWTGIWEPAREAISSQVEVLRRMDGGCAPVVSFSPGQRSALRARQRVVQLSGGRNVARRLLAASLEHLGDVSHVFGRLNCWEWLTALGRRPLLLTLVLPGVTPEAALYSKVSMFAAESELLMRDLRAAGIPDSQIRLVYPGVNLERFRPSTPPSGRFRVVFASTPADPQELDDRGILVLVSAARTCPDVDFVLKWRPWGNHALARTVLDALSPPANLIIETGDVADMSHAYRMAHATICMFAESYGKSCPNSVIEGLASGRPAIVSKHCGIAGLVSRAGAGLDVDREGRAVEAAVRSLQSNYAGYSSRARALAEASFGLNRFMGDYRNLYNQLSQSSVQARRPATVPPADRPPRVSS